jgi:hypothetical protein
MKPAVRWLIAAVLLLSPGCVKQPDWIESTLVTADVTGLWEGTVSGAAGQSAEGARRAHVDLEQEGPKVKGTFRIEGGVASGNRNSGPLEGRVGGDVFHFRVRGGGGFGETLTREATVSGDEMEGTLTMQFMAGPQTVSVSLRRVASPPHPRTQGP